MIMKDQARYETERPRMVPGSSSVRGGLRSGCDRRDCSEGGHRDWWESHRPITAIVATVAALCLLVVWLVLGIPCAILACVMNIKPKFE